MNFSFVGALSNPRSTVFFFSTMFAQIIYSFFWTNSYFVIIEMSIFSFLMSPLWLLTSRHLVLCMKTSKIAANVVNSTLLVYRSKRLEYCFLNRIVFFLEETTMCFRIKFKFIFQKCSLTLWTRLKKRLTWCRVYSVYFSRKSSSINEICCNV